MNGNGLKVTLRKCSIEKYFICLCQPEYIESLGATSLIPFFLSTTSQIIALYILY